MKKLHLFALPVIAATVLLSGCGPGDDAAPSADHLKKKKKPAVAEPATPAPTPAPAPAAP